MLCFKYGLLSLTRSKFRAALLALLLALVTAFLSLGIGMWRSAEAMLSDADKTFTTAGELIFMLGNYPETAQHDPQLDAAREALDLAELTRGGAVMAEHQMKANAFAAGYSAERGDMPMANFAVLTLELGYYYERMGGYIADITGVHYLAPESGNAASVSSTYISPPRDGRFTIEENRTYVMFGYFYRESGLLVNRFQVLTVSEALGAYAELHNAPPLVDITDIGDAFWDSSEGAYFSELARLLTVVNNGLTVVATSNVKAVDELHRGAQTIVQGGYFTDEDYKSGQSCIIPMSVADRLGVSVGDKLPLSIFPGDGKYWPSDGFVSDQEYTVTGIYQTDETGTPVYIPYAGQDFLETDRSDYTLGRVVVQNRRADEYLKKISGALPAGVRLELYDQGYSAAARPLMGMRETAVVISSVCAFACLIVLWFFAYLFVYRNGVAVRILLMLGTGTRRTRTYLLSGCAAIALIASAVGGAAGYLTSSGVISSVYNAAELNSVYDYRFSIKGYGSMTDKFTATVRTEPGAYILLALGIFLLSIIMCALFSVHVMRAQSARHAARRASKQAKARGGKSPARRSAAYIPMPGVALRYGVTSILRGGARSAAVPALFTALLAFMCVLTGMRAGFEQRLTTVYDDTPVTMKLTDRTGRRIDGLYIGNWQLTDIAETGFTSEGWSSANFRYMFSGITRYADGTIADPAPTPEVIPEEPWSREFYLGNLRANSAPVVMSGNIPRAPEFYYSGTPEVRWLPGLGWDDMGSNAPYCLVPELLMTQYGLSLGDEIMLSVFTSVKGNVAGDETYVLSPVFTVAGSFYSASTQGTIYVPEQTIKDVWRYIHIGMYTDENGQRVRRNIIYEEADRDPLTAIHSAAGFALQNTESLSELKDMLEVEYDQVGTSSMNRKWLIIEDDVLYDTIDELTRYISYLDMLLPVMLALVAVIGFVASMLLMKSRHAEIVILRSLGAGKARVFLSFFLESVILSIPGIALGLALAVPVTGGWRQDFAQNAALFAPCYYLGAAIAIVQVYRRAVLQSREE